MTGNYRTFAGVVVGKVGTATVAPEELLASFKR